MPSKRSGAPSTGDRHRNTGGTPVRPTTDHCAEVTIGRSVAVQQNGCWLYRGHADVYGRTRIKGESVNVHRFVYETLIGPIPDDYMIHHPCETKGCCNPQHLDAVTAAEHRRIHVGLGKDYEPPDDHIKRLRGEGWSLRRIATEVGLSHTQVSRVLTGHR